MNRLGYSILVTLLSPLLVLYLLARSKKSPAYRSRWGERFGITPLKSTDVLLHSVSMGETLAAVPLIRRLLGDNPNLTLTITTSSPTGSEQVHKAFAKELANGQVQHCYLPFDIPWCVKRFLKQVSPKLCVIMETELWPNLIYYAKRQGAKIMLANGRLSAKSFAAYQKRLELVAPMLADIDMFALQTQVESERYRALGVDAERICVCGSLKFDLQLDDSLPSQAQTQRQAWHKMQVPVWVAGSVHPGEFAAVINAHKALLSHHPEALLIMVPRHPEQFEAAAQALTQAQLSFCRRSDKSELTSSTQVLLGDTMGEMMHWYAMADLAFVGGSLIVHGGHNPLESAALGRPVMMGPNHRDFLEITEMLASAGNLVVVADGEALAKQLLYWFAHPMERQQAGEAGQQVLAANRGALSRQYQCLTQLVNTRPN